MPTTETFERFISRVGEYAHAEAIKSMSEISSVWIEVATSGMGPNTEGE